MDSKPSKLYKEKLPSLYNNYLSLGLPPASDSSASPTGQPSAERPPSADELQFTVDITGHKSEFVKSISKQLVKPESIYDYYHVIDLDGKIVEPSALVLDSIVGQQNKVFISGKILHWNSDEVALEMTCNAFAIVEAAFFKVDPMYKNADVEVDGVMVYVRRREAEAKDEIMKSEDDIMGVVIESIETGYRNSTPHDMVTTSAEACPACMFHKAGGLFGCSGCYDDVGCSKECERNKDNEEAHYKCYHTRCVPAHWTLQTRETSTGPEDIVAISLDVIPHVKESFAVPAKKYDIHEDILLCFCSCRQSHWFAHELFRSS